MGRSAESDSHGFRGIVSEAASYRFPKNAGVGTVQGRGVKNSSEICSRTAAVAKPHRNLKKANHGARPANSKARKLKRKHIKT